MGLGEILTCEKCKQAIKNCDCVDKLFEENGFQHDWISYSKLINADKVLIRATITNLENHLSIGFYDAETEKLITSLNMSLNDFFKINNFLQ